MERLYPNIRQAGALFLAAFWVFLLVGRLTAWRGYAHLSGWFLVAIAVIALFALWNAFVRDHTHA